MLVKMLQDPRRKIEVIFSHFCLYQKISILYSFEIRKLTLFYHFFKRKIPSKIVVRHRLFQFDYFSYSDLTEVGEQNFCNVVRFELGGNLRVVLSVFGRPLKEYFAFYSNLQCPFSSV